MEDLDGAVRVEIAGAVATLTFDRPRKRNALTTAMYRELVAALRAVADDPAVRIVVFTGAAGAFCAGNDLVDMLQHPPTGAGDPPVEFLAALVELPQVLVAGVDGPAVGVGTTLLLHMDLVYATSRSFFAMPFVSLGLVPEAASTYLLPLLVGRATASELLLLDRRMGAAEAARIGLVNRVVDDGAALTAVMGDVVATLSSQPPRALLETRRLLRQQYLDPTRARMGVDSAVLQALIAEAAGAA